MLGWPFKMQSRMPRTIALGLVLVTFIFTFYFWRLGSLTHGLSAAEVSSAASSSSLHTLSHNPVYAPYKILSYGVQRIFGHSPLSARVVSPVLAVIFIFSFYQLVKGWFGRMIGFFATLFFATTPWFILLARNGGPEISLLLPVVVLAAYFMLDRSASRRAWLALLISAGLSLYLPGGLFLVAAGTLLVRQQLNEAARQLDDREKFFGSLFFLLILGPLIYSCALNPLGLKPLLLIPGDWPSLVVGLKTFVWDILALFWRTPVHADFIIGRLPMFAGAQIALAFFGGFALVKLARDKLYLVVSMALFGILAAAINRELVLLTFALPSVALCVAGGLRYLYMQWRSVFPKNPLPKYLAIALITALSLMQVFYGLRYSLIAWPNTSATRSTYVLK